MISGAAEFEHLMEEIDTDLQRRNVSLAGRELRFFQEVAKRTKQSIPLGGPFDCSPKTGVYVGPSLTGHINAWVQRRYGDRLKVDMSLGYTALLLRSDVWLMRVPVIFGAFRAIVSRDLDKRYPNVVVYNEGTTELLTINILRMIQDLPQGLADVLTVHELNDVLFGFQESYSALRFLDQHRQSDELAMAAGEDLTNSAKKSVGSPDGYGMARWDALQAAEKALKLFLSRKMVSFPKGRNGHDLLTLVNLAVAHGLSSEARTLIASIQCDAAVRYERGRHTRRDIVQAHRNATRIVCRIALAMQTVHESEK
jgi:hypothetical protein